MSKNEFDELLLKKLQEEDLPYNPAHWDKLARSLPPTLAPASVPGNSRPWLRITGIAAAVALLLATVLVVQLNRKQMPEQTLPAVAHQPAAPVQKTPVPQPSAATATQQIAQTAPANKNTPAGTATPQPGHPVPVQQATGYGPVNQPVGPGVIDRTKEPQIAVSQPEQSPVDPAAPVKEEKIAHPNPVMEHNATAYAPGNNRKDMAFASPFYEGKDPGKQPSKTSVSLGGGVNYGNLNTGYTAGISVRRKVAGDFFVDGSVAMMYNNNANNVAANNGPSLGDGPTAARPASFNQTTLASPALDPIQKLYYVQFNPSIGYQVEKHVALSIGGDFQQMLNRQEEIVQPESNNAKVFPTFDVGLTTKSEFAITPNIQAGLMYREGLNSLVKNEGSRYVNRRYVQVQFKYNIPVN